MFTKLRVDYYSAWNFD